MGRPLPRLDYVPMHGNANKRLAELLEAGGADTLLLAVASLEQIGRRGVVTMILSTESMMPPIGSDVLALLCERQGAAV